MKMRYLALVASFGLLMPCQAQETRAATAIWLTHSMDRVMRERSPSLWEPLIHAAKGEWEALQAVVTGVPDDVQGVRLTATSLQGPGDALIPAPVLLREHYVQVKNSSEAAPLPPGDYPDALTPQNFPAQTLPKLARASQPFWVDIYVPPDAKPGLYQGKLAAVLASGQRLETEFTLKVWDFSLPRLPALKSSIFLVWRRLAKVHGFDPEASTAPPRLQHILDAYYDMLVEHRLSPHEAWATYPDDQDPLSDGSFQRMEAALRQHLLQRGAGMVGLPLWETWPLGDPLGKDRHLAMAYVLRYYRICERMGCADRLYKIFGDLDEPNSKPAYEHAREWGKFFRELKDKHDIRVPLLITEQPTPDEADWGSLVGGVDIWSAHVSAVWQDLESAKPTLDITKRLKAGEEVWTYTALVQAPEEWKAKHNHPAQIFESQPPVWLTDYPPMNYRILAWLMPRHGVTGITYWDTSFWPEGGFDVWSDAGTYPHDNSEVYNGDGQLIYPAFPQRHGQEGPVASLRLKWLRESADDYDYIHLLSQRGFKNLAMEAGQTFARGFGDWNDNTAALFEAREKLGSTLEKLNTQRPAQK